MTTRKQETLFLLSILCVTPGCGRKKRKFFYSDDPTPLEHERVAPLSLPLVTGITSHHTNAGNVISWRTVPTHQLSSHTKLIGYHIYRFTPHSFIPKTSLNKKPLSKTSYIDAGATPHHRYVVRAVYMHYDQTIHGPFSQVSATQKK